MQCFCSIVRNCGDRIPTKPVVPVLPVLSQQASY